ncbi:hypothetical protein MRO55_25345, partial [Escherichia coli]|uniref:hypothetical protein n=1 Tax=Escherichia coli TaxID=562 RepID=UPI002113E281
IHGRVERPADDGTAVLTASDDLPLTAAIALAGTVGDEWRLVSPEFADVLTAPLRVELGIRDCNREDVQDWVRAAHTEVLAAVANQFSE